MRAIQALILSTFVAASSAEAQQLSSDLQKIVEAQAAQFLKYTGAETAYFKRLTGEVRAEDQTWALPLGKNLLDGKITAEDAGFLGNEITWPEENDDFEALRLAKKVLTGLPSDFAHLKFLENAGEPFEFGDAVVQPTRIAISSNGVEYPILRLNGSDGTRFLLPEGSTTNPLISLNLGSNVKQQQIRGEGYHGERYFDASQIDFSGMNRLALTPHPEGSTNGDCKKELAHNPSLACHFSTVAVLQGSQVIGSAVMISSRFALTASHLDSGPQLEASSTSVYLTSIRHASNSNHLQRCMRSGDERSIPKDPSKPVTNHAWCTSKVKSPLISIDSIDGQPIDLMLLEIENPLPNFEGHPSYVPLLDPMKFHMVTPSVRLVAAGYGPHEKPARSAGERRVGYFRLESGVGNPELLGYELVSEQFETPTGIVPGQGCEGDSGGPVYAQTSDGKMFIVGIYLGGNSEGNKCNSHARILNLANSRVQIAILDAIETRTKKEHRLADLTISPEGIAEHPTELLVATSN